MHKNQDTFDSFKGEEQPDKDDENEQVDIHDEIEVPDGVTENFPAGYSPGNEEDDQ